MAMYCILGAKNASPKANNSCALHGSSWQCDGRQSQSQPLLVPAPAQAALAQGSYLLSAHQGPAPSSWVGSATSLPPACHPRFSGTSPSAVQSIPASADNQTRCGECSFFPWWNLVSFTKRLCVLSFCCKVWIFGGSFSFPCEPGSWDPPTLTHWMCLLANNYSCNQKSALTAQSLGTLLSTGLIDQLVTICLPVQWC